MMKEQQAKRCNKGQSSRKDPLLVFRCCPLALSFVPGRRLSSIDLRRGEPDVYRTAQQDAHRKRGASQTCPQPKKKEGGTVHDNLAPTEHNLE